MKTGSISLARRPLEQANYYLRTIATEQWDALLDPSWGCSFGSNTLSAMRGLKVSESINLGQWGKGKGDRPESSPQNMNSLRGKTSQSIIKQ